MKRKQVNLSKSAGLTAKKRAWNSPVVKLGNWICITCKQEKELESCFYKNSASKTGFGNNCKGCEKIRNNAKQKRRCNESLEYFLKRLISGRFVKMGAKAKKLGWDYDINEKFLLNKFEKQKGKCAITGVEMTHFGGKGKVDTNVSIDRIDSNIGYTKENIQLVCYIVNVIKNKWDKETLIKWCDLIIKNQCK